MSHERACETDRWVQAGDVALDHCPNCDIFHLTVGPVSLRVDASMLDGLYHVLLAAQQRQARRLDRVHLPHHLPAAEA